MGYKNILNFTCFTMKFHIGNNANVQISAWILRSQLRAFSTSCESQVEVAASKPISMNSLLGILAFLAFLVSACRDKSYRALVASVTILIMVGDTTPQKNSQPNNYGLRKWRTKASLDQSKSQNDSDINRPLYNG